MIKQISKYKAFIVNLDEVFYDSEQVYYNSLLYSAGVYGRDIKYALAERYRIALGESIVEVINSFVHEKGLKINPEITPDLLISRFATAIYDSLINSDQYKSFLQFQRSIKNAKWIFVSFLDDEILYMVSSLVQTKRQEDCIIIGGPSYDIRLEKNLILTDLLRTSLYIGASKKSKVLSARLGIKWLEVTGYARDPILASKDKDKKKPRTLATFRLLNLYRRYPKLDESILKVIDRYLPISDFVISDIDSMFLVMMAFRKSFLALIDINNAVKKLPGQHKVSLTKILVSKMQEMPFITTGKATNDGINKDRNTAYHISLISPLEGFSLSSHSIVMLGHLKAMLICDSVAKITLIFTCESSAKIWSLPDEKLTALSHEEIYKISKEDGISCISDKLSKLTIIHAPKPGKLYDNLGDVVFRFEGVSSRLSHQLYLRSIYACRPVITITFSSHVRTGAFTDLILSRHKIAMPREFTYTHPYGKSLVIDVMENSDSASNTIIITAYGGPRIAAGLRNISSDAWGKLDSVFSENRDIKWFLVGVNDIDSALSAINKSFLAKHGDRLSIMPYSNLEELYKKAKIFLTLPNTFGGGGGATMALARAVPLVACKDTASDISNSLPDHLLTDTYEDALDFLSKLLTDKILYVDVVKQQQFHLKSRMDLSACSNDMLASINEAIIRYARRQPIFIDDNSPVSNN
ncbi:MAG: hypothetical protein FJ240_11715 [Nitrospira sp.]|nr:hypothetical protein [Nitrospira sp.]